MIPFIEQDFSKVTHRRNETYNYCDPQIQIFFHSTSPRLPFLIPSAADKRVVRKGIVLNEFSEHNHLNQTSSIRSLSLISTEIVWGKELLKQLEFAASFVSIAHLPPMENILPENEANTEEGESEKLETAS